VSILNVVHDVDIVPQLLEKNVMQTHFTKVVKLLREALKLNRYSWVDKLALVLKTVD
jgi:hypothetical protein